MSIWKPLGARQKELLPLFPGSKSMACFLIAKEGLETDSQLHITLPAAFMSHHCATEWQCLLPTLLGDDAFISLPEDLAHPQVLSHAPWKERKTSSELGTCF
jgi:hypothetical protein